jgi:ABC-type lipoprotein export system ATPase subunit
MTQAPSVYEDLTVQENLRYFARIHGAEVGEIVNRVGLSEQSSRLVRSLSGGQRTRVSLATVPVGSPPAVAAGRAEGWPRSVVAEGSCGGYSGSWRMRERRC